MLFCLTLAAAAHFGTIGPKPIQHLSSTSLGTRIEGFDLEGEKFTENLGQWDARAKFLARSRDVDVWVTATGIRYDWHGPSGSTKQVDMEFVGASGHGRAVGAKPTAGVSNFLCGKHSATGARSFEQAEIKDLYPGIDLVTYIDKDAHRPRYDLVVHPGSDTSRIKIRYQGAKNLGIVGGAVRYDLGFGQVSERKMLAYQGRGEGREVRDEFVPREIMNRDGTVGFKVGAYDKARTLVIDPLIWSTYLGGSVGDGIGSVKVAQDGSIVVCGYTSSPGWTTSGTFSGAMYDSLIARFTSTGTLVYSTDFGGSTPYTTAVGNFPAGTSAYFVDVDANDCTYFAGGTSSGSLPVTDGSSFVSGEERMYVAKLNADGSLAYAKYIGSDYSVITGLAVTPAGLATFIATDSSGALPIVNALYPSTDGGPYLCQINSDGSGFNFATFIADQNGVGDGYPEAVALDGSGNIYICGYESSASFLTTPGAYQPAGLCGQGAYVQEFGADGQSLIYSTVVGGTTPADQDAAYYLAVDGAGNAYLAGAITNGATYPVTVPTYGDYVLNSGKPAPGPIFVTEVAAGGGSLVYSTLLGGTGFVDAPDSISVDSSGRALVSAYTGSADFPLTNSAYGTALTGEALFQLAPGGTSLLYSTTFPSDYGCVATYDLSGNAVLAGFAQAGFPTTSGAYDTTFNPSNTQGMGFVSVLQMTELTYLHLAGSVAGGSSVTGTVAVVSVAPPGGLTVNLSSDNLSVATVPASVTIPSGTSTATFSVSTSGVAVATTAHITATATGVTKTAALNVKPSVSLSTIVLSPASVVGGVNGGGTVTLSGAAPTGGVSVALSSASSAAVVPANVTVQGGQTSAPFTISTSGVATQTTTSISATFGVTRSTGLTLKVPQFVALTRVPATIVGGGTATGTVTLNGLASASGVTISLGSNNACATVPASVTVTSGNSSANFSIITGGVSALTPVLISGTLGSTTRSIGLTVEPPALAYVSLSPASVVGGKSSSGTVALASAAPTGGITVTIQSNSASATLPAASVTIPAGQKTGTFTVNTPVVSTTTSATISATLGAYQKSVTLTVQGPAMYALRLPSTVQGGHGATGTIVINMPAAAGGVTVNLAYGACLTGPATILVTEGTSQATFPILATTVGANTNTTVTASVNGTTRTVTVTVKA